MAQTSIKHQDKIITRFAPSPSGYLHLGHAYSALLNYNFACDNKGKFILRIENIDHLRCNTKYEQSIYDDLTWLGISWETPVRRQSEHFDIYKDALNKLDNLGLLYPCFCTRKDIKEEIDDSSRAPHMSPMIGPEGVLYPGICKHLSNKERKQKLDENIPYALRINMDEALKYIEEDLFWTDLKTGTQKANPTIVGDAVLARKDFPASYHLSVVIDDHIQQVSHVIRGEDLYYACHFHRLLQYLLKLNTVVYDHHALLREKDGDRLAKRNKSASLQTMRKSGFDPLKIPTLIKEYL